MILVLVPVRMYAYKGMQLLLMVPAPTGVSNNLNKCDFYLRTLTYIHNNNMISCNEYVCMCDSAPFYYDIVWYSSQYIELVHTSDTCVAL